VLPIHILAGGLSILLGATALMVRKGGSLHRRVGLAFVCAMAVMGISASVLALRKNPFDANVPAAFMTLYFVGTALTTVRPPSTWTRRFTVVAMLVAIGMATLDIIGGVRAFRSPRGALAGVPFPMFFFLATVLLLAAFGDLRQLRANGVRGVARLRRHLWRMCFALFIAAGSFFSIRERVASILPEPFPSAPMRVLAILLPFAAMFYWLWRVRHRGAMLAAPSQSR
jgi:uncharacterized membrane protein